MRKGPITFCIGSIEVHAYGGGSFKVFLECLLGHGDFLVTCPFCMNLKKTNSLYCGVP